MSFGAKNTPWGRAASGAQQLNPQIFTGQLGGMGAFVSQAALNSLNAAGLGVGALGIQAVNAAAFAAPHQATFAGTVGYPAAALGRPQSQATTAALVAQQQQQQKQRAFIGTVTKLQDQYGFVDEDVFFQTNVVRGAIPHIGDKVMVEAAFNPNMPFKWNAFRVQLLPNQDVPQIQQQQTPQQAVRNVRDDRWMDKRDVQPPPQRRPSPPIRRSPLPIRRPSPPIRRSPPPMPRRRSPSPAPVRPSAAASTTSSLKREHSPRRSPTRDTDVSRSPPRRRQRLAAPRYNVTVPKFSLDLEEANVFEIRKRYSNMYVPSDFFNAKMSWLQTFPMYRPFSLDHTVLYHVMHKDVDFLTPNDAILDPPDADYRYSAKVMLVALPTLQEMYKKTLGLQEDGRLKTDEFETTHPNRLISFLVGLKGKSEVLSIGGPWSVSLDGADPENDPRVLIKTAIRTTKALTGVDLSKCTQWYKFLEVRYRRIDKEISTAATKEDGMDVDGGETISNVVAEPRVDTVVIFVPDVWNTVPTKLEFEGLQNLLKRQLDSKLSSLDSSSSSSSSIVVGINNSNKSAGDVATADEQRSVNQPQPQPQQQQQQQQQQDKVEEETTPAMTNAEPMDTSETDSGRKPTHWSKLDVKSMKVGELKSELDARNLDCKGIKSQLVSKLIKAVKEEQEEEEKMAQVEEQAENILAEAAGELSLPPPTTTTNENVVEKQPSAETTKEDVKPKKSGQEETKSTPTEAEKAPIDEKELKKRKEREEKEKRERKKDLEKHLVFTSSNPGIVVYPHKTAKGGKFDCKVMTLAALLDYRPEDNKEHSFEVALFAESFNEMILRDGAFAIYKSIVGAPEKEDEKKDKKESKKSAGKDEKKTTAVDSKTEDTQDSIATPETTPNQESSNVDTKTSLDESQTATSGGDLTSSTPTKEQEKEKDNKSKQGGGTATKRKSRSRSPRDKEERKGVGDVVVKEPAMLLYFSLFDLSRCGYLYERDTEDILLSLGLCLTRAQIQKLIKKVFTRDTFNYRKLTDQQVTSKDAKIVVAKSDDEDLASGNLPLLPWKFTTPTDSNVFRTRGRSEQRNAVDDSGTVVYRDTVVDVGQVLLQLERLKKEQKTLEQRHATLEKDLKHSKEQKDNLERRKRRLEDDVRDYKKRLYDAEKCLKNSQDDTVQLKTSLQRCKEWGESISRLVDKTLPKREPSAERSTKSNKSDKQQQKENVVVKDERNGDTNKAGETTSFTMKEETATMINNEIETSSNVVENDNESTPNAAKDETITVVEEVDGDDVDKAKEDTNVAADEF